MKKPITCAGTAKWPGLKFIKYTLGTATLVAVAFMAVGTYVRAHGSETSGGGPSIELTPTNTLEGDEVPIEAHITEKETPVTNLKVTFTIDQHNAGISDTLQTQEREPGHYFTKYKFSKPGEYEVHVEFMRGGQLTRAAEKIIVLRSGIDKATWYFVLTALMLIIIIWITPMRGKKKGVKRAITFTIIITAVAWLSFSLYQVYKTGARSAGIITCPNESVCFLTAHIHAFIPIQICGENIRLKTEMGPLTGPHTHKEKNIIHWHDRLPYDNVEKKLLDTAPLTLGAFFDAMDMTFSKTGIGGKQNGAACPDGSTGTLKMFVNGAENDEFRDYVWTDKDVIQLFFDSRTVEEIKNELQENHVKFPSLGRG